MAPSLFTLPALVLLFFINLALGYLCLNLKDSKRFCRVLPFFLSGFFTVLCQLLLECNDIPAQAIVFVRMQYLGFWSYFITVPLLVNALTESDLKPWIKWSLGVFTLTSIMTLFTDAIITSEPILYHNYYFAQLGRFYPIFSSLLFLVCILSYRNILIYANKLEDRTLQIIMPVGLGLCLLCGLLDYGGKLRGSPLLPGFENTFSLGMVIISLSFGIFILVSYACLIREYHRSLANLEFLLQKNVKSFDEFVQLIARTIDAKDKYTAGHSLRVAEYAVRIARRLNLEERQIELLRKACLLHDIGKIGIPDGVLNKKSPLTDKERSYIFRHPILGKEILSQMSEFHEILDIIYFHHEHYNGSGYPHGLKEDEIPLLARILAVADAYDAMLSERPYRPPKTKLEAIKELLNFSGKQFDPYVVEKFIESLYQENCEISPDNRPD
ncbi:MAG: HD-GYP domain-containing protein [candidate division WOR-3 bacterium]